MNVNLNIRIDEDLRNQFKEVAESNAQTPSLLIRKWIENYIKENKKETREVEIIKIEGIQEFTDTLGLDNETIVLSKVTFEDSTEKYMVQYELDGVAGHTEDEFFETEKEAINFINDQI